VAGEVTEEQPLAAGAFSAWLAAMQRALRGEIDASVPCDGCTACCTASQFVHIGPDETDTLAHIPRALLFPAPGLPQGNVLMGYDEHGSCPMLVDGTCSIYEHRPRTCRTYDCRVFPASGVELDDAAKLGIARRAARWRFTFATDRDRSERDAVRAAATYFADHQERFPDRSAPMTATQRAVVAVERHGDFLDARGT
jgi:hypothetical protein